MSVLIPNTHQTPNAYVDEFMCYLTNSELRVLWFAIRHIYGWQDRIADRRGVISLEMFVNGFTTKAGKQFNGCGLQRQAVITALQSLERFGFIARVGKATRDGQRWELKQDGIDLEGLHQRQAEGQEAGKKRTTNARQKRASGMSDNTSMSDITSNVVHTARGNVGHTASGNVAHTESNSTPNPSSNPYKDSAPVGAGAVTPPDDLPLKGKDETPKDTTPGLAVNAIIAAYLATGGAYSLEIIQPNAYGNKTMRAGAKALHERGITPEIVTAYLKAKRTDRFWHEKPIKWDMLLSEIVGYHERTRSQWQPAVPDEPDPYVYSAQPLRVPGQKSEVNHGK